MKPVVNINDLQPGMLIWAKYPGTKDHYDYWTKSWGGLLEVLKVCVESDDIDAQILNGGLYHASTASYAKDELFYL